MQNLTSCYDVYSDEVFECVRTPRAVLAPQGVFRLGLEPCIYCRHHCCHHCCHQAVMIIADATTTLEVSGKGELLEPADGVHAIGSGARFAVAAARALMTTALPPLEIAQRAMAVSAARCVYTNRWVLNEGGGELV